MTRRKQHSSQVLSSIALVSRSLCPLMLVTMWLTHHQHAVDGHGIQRPVKVSSRKVKYDNHPFQDQISVYDEVKRLDVPLGSDRSATAQDIDSPSTPSNRDLTETNNNNVHQNHIVIRSSTVPPLSLLLANSTTSFEEDQDPGEIDLQYRYEHEFGNITDFNVSTIGPLFPFKTSSKPEPEASEPISGDETTRTSTVSKSYLPSSEEYLTYKSNYRPLRIVAFLSKRHTRYLTPHQLDILQHIILEPSLTAWSDALHTVPVGEGNPLTLDTSQLEGGIFCGAEISEEEDEDALQHRGDRVRIPSHHIQQGVKDADTVIYVTLGFPSDWLEMQKTEEEQPLYAQELYDEEVEEEEMDPLAIENETDAHEEDWVRHRFYRARVPSMPQSQEDGTESKPSDGESSSNREERGSSDSDRALSPAALAPEDSLPSAKSTAAAAYGEEDPVVLVETENELNDIDAASVSSEQPEEVIPDDGPTESESTPAPDASLLSQLPPPPSCAHPTNILASASFCNSDQYDRPIAGVLHICISDPSFFHEHVVATKTVIHEIGHIMGFNPISLAHFRFPDGSPMTDRQEDGNVPLVEAQCAGVKTVTGEPFPTVKQPLPSENTLRFNVKRTGVRVAEVVTDTVAMVTRNQFGCDTLEGAELESFVPSAFAQENPELNAPPPFCIGSHWSRRLFQTDLMNPIVDYAPTPIGWRFNETSLRNDTNLLHYKWRLSPLTLAYFVDSGWYRVNPARTSHVHGWGRGAGCAFVDQPCVDPTTGLISPQNEAYFCNKPLLNLEVHGCTGDFTRKAVCELVDFSQVNQADLTQTPVTLPEPFLYFNNSFGDTLTAEALGLNVNGKRAKRLPTHAWGGKESDMEYCPYFRGFSNGVCNSKETEQILSDKYSEEISVNSRCVVSSVSRMTTGLCIPIACVVSDQSLRIKVDGVWKRCRFAGQRHFMWWNDRDYVECPDPVRTCPTFYCPRNCLGTNNGVCDFDTGACMCLASKPGGMAVTERKVSKRYNVSNGTHVPCDIPAEFQIVNGSFYEGNDPAGWARMDLSLSEYYVQDSTALLNEGKRLSSMLLRFFKTANPFLIFLFCIGCILLIFGFGWIMFLIFAPRDGRDGDMKVLRFRFPTFRPQRRGSGSTVSTSDEDHSEKADDKTIASAAMLMRLRIAAFRNKERQQKAPQDKPQ